jgi:magnesium chelatase subunit D
VSAGAAPEVSVWTDAQLAAALFAVDTAGTGGIVVRALAGPVRDAWLAQLRALLPAGAPVRRVPVHVTDGRLLGGLDLAATLQAGRPVAERGVLSESDGGVMILAMAERLEASTAARVAAALDAGEVALERDGLALRVPARFGVVALDEGAAEDERPSRALLDRLAFHLDFSAISMREVDAAVGLRSGAGAVAAARARLAEVEAGNDIVSALCATAVALGIDSLRAPLLALRVARAAAALAGRNAVTEADAATAGRLVFAPRATVLPAPEQEAGEESADAATEPAGGDRSGPQSGDPEQESDVPAEPDRPLEDVVLAAAEAAIPAGLLLQLRMPGGVMRARAAGRAGALQRGGARGRPEGVRRGELRAGARLSVIETLRAAAPWQPLRCREAAGDRQRPRIEVRREDFRVTRYRQRAQTTTIFVVDASGSAALHRLAEAKGAVELLLADCYVRRDRVALLAFRGRGAELLLSPTRSLARAKRSLAGLPGGGGTPLAAGIEAALVLADAVRRKGDTPTLVLLTDGRANIARDGAAGRARAEAEALVAARAMRAAGFAVLLVDTAPRPETLAARLSAEMGARYLPLPHAGAVALAAAVKAAGPR